MYSYYIAHQIFEILSDQLPFLSYNYTYYWFYVSHLGVHFSKVMFLLYFHINDNDSFLHTAWACLLHPNLVIATLTSMQVFIIFETNHWNVRKCFLTLHKKWSFPLRISSVNMTKSAVFIFCAELCPSPDARITFF